MTHDAREDAPTYFVRTVPGGYAVFTEHGHKISEVFEHRHDALAEARGYGGIVLVEGDTGHIEREVV